MADDGGFNAAFALLDRKSTADMLGPQEVELWRGRMRTRALEADSQRGVQVPVEASMPPDANWNAGLSAFTQRQHGRGGAPLRAGGRCRARPGLVVDAVGRLVLGGARQPAGRQPAEVRALSQARRAARPHLLWPDRAEGAGHADRAGLERAARSTAAGPTCCSNDRAGRRALALLQLGAATAAERELFAASIDADPQYIETVLAVAQKASLPGLSVRIGNANWDQRHNIKGYDGAMYPMPPWQPAGGYLARPRAGLGLHAPGIGVQSQGALLCRRHGADAAHAGHGAARDQQLRARDQAGGNPYDPSTNMALGQAYIGSLLGEVDNNLVRTAAGYNGGPGNVMRWDNSLNASADPLLYIATIPLNETRDFVQRVLANYWMYQIRLGQPTPSLDQIAAHEWPRYSRRTPPDAKTFIYSARRGWAFSREARKAPTRASEGAAARRH